MPLVAHSDLPTFARLESQGHELLSLQRAVHQDIRELHIGFLNMMPDAALQATERQFIRLVGACNRIAQFFVYPFSLPQLGRNQETRDYIERYYSDFDELKEQGLDALIITGANVANPALDREAFWGPLIEVVARLFRTRLEQDSPSVTAWIGLTGERPPAKAMIAAVCGRK